MPKKKLVSDKDIKDNITLEKETPYWELAGYTAEEWQGRLHAQKVGDMMYELAPYEADFSEFVG
jgi:hypothetical protein